MLSATAIYPSETGDHMVPLYPVYTLHKRDAAAAPRHHNDARDDGEVEGGGRQAAFLPSMHVKGCSRQSQSAASRPYLDSVR